MSTNYNLPTRLERDLLTWKESIKGKHGPGLWTKGMSFTVCDRATNKPRTVKLSGTQVLVVQFVSTGLCNKTMADIMGISIKTIEKHRQLAMNRTGLNSPVALTHFALQNQLITLGQVVL
jgi:DNA-binding NarL/FixJ family response regulator